MSEGTRWEAEAGGRTVTNPERPPGTPQVQTDNKMLVKAVTIAPKALPIITPIDKSITLPFVINFLNSCQSELALLVNLFSFFSFLFIKYLVNKI